MARGMWKGWRTELALLLFLLVLVPCRSTVNGVPIEDSRPILQRLEVTNESFVPSWLMLPTCHPLDAVALLSFKSQLKDPSQVLSSWNPLTDCCGWRGVTCNSSSSHSSRVVGLQLSVLEGESPSSFLSLDPAVKSVFELAGAPLATLSSLETLSFTSVKFNTRLPASWGFLSNLVSLSLIDCSFTGDFPLSFLRLRKLEHLQLSSNKLFGQIPIYFIAFERLMSLDLSHNGFTGGMLNVFKCNQLTYLDLSHNLFDDLPNLFSFLSKLQHLDLAHNQLPGSIPSTLQMLFELRVLDLSVNRLRGEIPWFLISLPELQSVEIHDNALSGSIPEGSPMNSKLRTMDFSHNSLSGAIPFTIGNFGQLQSLDLSFNNLTGGIPSTLDKKLEYVFLQCNNLSGFIPQELSMLSNLQIANVSNNWLVGPIPGGPWATFPKSSYEHNMALCGSPLQSCNPFSGPTNEAPPPPQPSSWLPLPTIPTLPWPPSSP